jgi:hypothetical protein
MEHFAVSAASCLLISVVLPLWIAAGLADYLCHRATSIETTSGTPESVLHLVQFASMGIPVTAALFLQINAGYFLFAFAFLVLHHAVAAVDLVYANPKRRIAPREQMVHSFLEIMPFTAYVLLGVLYWPQLLAVFGRGPQAAVYAPVLQPLPLRLLMGILASALFFNFLPYLEELWRCLSLPKGDRGTPAGVAR